MEFTKEVTVEIDIDADDIVSAFYGNEEELLEEIGVSDIVEFLTDNMETEALLNRLDNEAIIKYLISECGGSTEMLDLIPNEVIVDYVVHNTDNDKLLREVHDDLILKYVTRSIPLPHTKRVFEEAGYEIVHKGEKPTLLSILKGRDVEYQRLLLTSEEKAWLFGNMEATDLINIIFARRLTLSLMEEFIKRSVKLGTDQRLVALQQEENNNNE